MNLHPAPRSPRSRRQAPRARWGSCAALALGVVAAAAVGCPESVSPEKAFIEEFNRLSCEGLAACCTGLDTPIDVDECVSSPFLSRSASSLEGFEQAKADTCLDELRAWSAATCAIATPTCNELLPSPESTEPAGTARTGEACEFDSDCAAVDGGEVACDYDFDTDTRQCVVNLRVDAGATCVGTCEALDGGGRSCTLSDDTARERPVCHIDDGVFCDAGTCQPLSSEGEACGTETCAEGLYCAFDDPAGAVCRPALPLGSACTASASCAGGYCASATSTCEPTVPPGGACDPASFDAVCGAGSSCNDAGACEPFGAGLGVGLLCSFASAF